MPRRFLNLGPNAPTFFGDSLEVSASGRLLVSQPVTLLSSQQQYGDNTDVWETSVTGTGAITFLPNESTIQMSPGGTVSGASAIRQTKPYQRYTPGHGLTIHETFCFDGGVDQNITGNVRRLGYFDANDGVFLEAGNGVVSFCQRSSVSGTPSDALKVPQTSWSYDAFDGAGPSGKILDWSKTQCLLIDLRWLGVGRVRLAFEIDGVAYLAHEFDNANVNPTVYMKTANLPCRFETVNTGTASSIQTLRQICTSVESGGGAEPEYGKMFTYNNGGAGTAIGAAARIPLISVRAKTTGPNSVRNTGRILVGQYDVAAIGANPVFWELVLNPTLTGATFAAMDATNSIAEVDKAATAVSGGVVLDAGYLAASAQSKGLSTQFADLKSLVLAYSGLLNHQDVMTLVGSAPGGATTAFANMQWLEMW